MTAACDVQHCKETFWKHLTVVDAHIEYNHVSSIWRKKCSFACYSIMLLLKNQKSILSLSETDTELTFPQEEKSWCRVPCRPAFHFCFLCFPTTSIKVFCYVKFYCNQNTRDQEFMYVFSLPSGLWYAFKLLCFLGRQQLFFKTLCAWRETGCLVLETPPQTNGVLVIVSPCISVLPWCNLPVGIQGKVLSFKQTNSSSFFFLSLFCTFSANNS